MRPSLLLLATLLVATTLSLASQAHAKDMRGKLGVGAARSLSGAEGLTVRYWATRSVGVELLGGVGLTRMKNDSLRTTLAGGFQLIYVLRELGPANLLAGIRGTVGYVNDDSATSGQGSGGGTAHIAVELPVTVEYHFADAFSVHLAFGLLASFIPEDGAILEGGPILVGGGSEPGSVALGLGSGGLFGGAGFTFYF
jgi:hypothetical protein